MNKGHMDETLEVLDDVRWSYLAFLLLSFVLAIIYSIQLVRKRSVRMRLLPKPLVDTTVEITTSVEDLLSQDEPDYAAPPPFPYPGKPAAPHFWVVQPAVKSNALPGQEDIDQVRRECGRCYRQLRENETCNECIRDMLAQQQMSRRTKIQKYIYAFAAVAQVRLAMLVFVDMPQAILVVRLLWGGISHRTTPIRATLACAAPPPLAINRGAGVVGPVDPCMATCFHPAPIQKTASLPPSALAQHTMLFTNCVVVVAVAAAAAAAAAARSCTW